MADPVTMAMELADTYAQKRARCAAYPFTTEEEEKDAERQRDEARAALHAHLVEWLGATDKPTINEHEIGPKGWCIHCGHSSVENIDCIWREAPQQ